jgi:uncharacterized protein (DUF305 family)
MGMVALAMAALQLAPLVQAGPVHAGVPAGASPGGASGAMGSAGMPMGGHSADAHFIRMMIPHHEGAIAMAELASQRAHHPEIRALAESIRSSQGKEIAQMHRWYRQWYASEVPIWRGAGRGMGGGMGMPGFGTSLEALRSAADFDRAFLEQMIAYHRMGVMMATPAQWNTTHPELRELEAAMVRVQSEEIERMGRWYQLWFGSSVKK